MSRLKKITFLIIATLIFVQCTRENKFLVEKGKVGEITANTSLDELKSIFVKDSLIINLVSDIDKDTKQLFSFPTDEFIVYSKEGGKMLQIVPAKINDSVSKIRSVQIFDSNFKTDKGISLQSTFKDINENYMVNKVEASLSSATLFIDELNATIAIDKSELGINQFSREEITIDQIPDIAKIKYFTIWFN